MFWTIVLVPILLLTGCGPGRQTPADRVPADGQVVHGTERLVWNQAAPDAASIARYRYAAYIDDRRTGLKGAICSFRRGPAGFTCSAPLPPLSPGRHVIELVTLDVVAGQENESVRSAPTIVDMIGTAEGVVAYIGDRTFRSGAATYDVRIVARNLTVPAAMASAPDRRLLVAERSGTIKMVHPDTDAPIVALTPDDVGESGSVIAHALALHPFFARNGYVFLLYTVLERTRAVMRLVRLREVGDTLGEPAVLLNDLPSTSIEPTGALAFGPDGKLYVATNGTDAGRAGADAALAGKVLRLNDDGTAADNAVAGSPVWASGVGAPVALEWDPNGHHLWVVQRSAPTSDVDTLARTGVGTLVRPSAAGARVYRGTELPGFRYDLFIAREDGCLERATFDPMRGMWTTQDRLLPEWFGRLQSVAEGPEGALYVGSGNSARAGVAGQDVVIRIVRGRSR